MNSYTPTQPQPANLLKVGAVCLHEGAAHRCIRRAATIHLADVQTGAVREVSGVTVVTRAVPAATPGVILGHAPGGQTTVGDLPAGALVLVRTGVRWELARADPSIITVRGRRARGFKAVTPWQRSPTRFRARLDAPCWLAVQVAEVPLKHVRAKPAPVKRVRPSRALGRAPWREPPKPPRQKKPVPAVQPPRVAVARSAPIVDVPPPPPPPRVIAPVPEGAREWWTLHRTTKRGQQETLLFAERADADAYVRTRGLERVPTRLRGNVRTEATEDGLLRAYLPPPSFGGKPIPVKKARLPYKDDDDRDDD
jgi:hypothetical protein